MLLAAYVVYGIVVALLVWNPDTSAPGTAVVDLDALFRRFGLPSTQSRVELGLNVVMFVPMSLLGAFLLRRWRIGDWVTAGFLATLLIEVVQRFFLPTRTGSARDVVANTFGALLGILAALALREVSARWCDRRRSGRPGAPSPASNDGER